MPSDGELILPGGVGVYRLSGQSALAKELVTISPRARRTLVPDVAVIAVDVVVATARLLTDDADNRPLGDRLDDLKNLMPHLIDERIPEAISWIESTVGKMEADRSQLERRLGRFTRPTTLQVARRLIGAAAYDRVYAAFQSDAAVIAVAIRRAMRYIMPLAVAVDDLAAVVPNDDLGELDFLKMIDRSALAALMNLDVLFDNMLDGKLSLVGATQRVDEYRATDLDEIDNVLDRLRQVIESQTRSDLQALSRSLARKIQGAEDALAGSADAASQAANSLLEFIDRTMRQSFEEAYVLEWSRRNGLSASDYEYVTQNGRTRPTKRSQALCFVHAGKDISEGPGFHALAAASLNQTRKALQKIKHADRGTPEEIAEIQTLQRSIHGFVTYAIRVGWAAADSEAVNELRTRLSRT